MRQDVKRAFIVWPLTAATLASLVVFVTFSNDSVSRTVVDRSADAWVAAGGPAFWENQEVASRLAHRAPNAKPHEMVPSTTQEPLAAIEAWNDVPIETVALPAVPTVGVPTATLNSSTDLFGFPLVGADPKRSETNTAERRENGAAAMPRPARIDDTDSSASVDCPGTHTGSAQRLLGESV